jgi:tetratricopeptide (TPR) repeat protein
MKGTLASPAVVLALCVLALYLPRGAAGEDEEPFEVRLVVPVPLAPDVAEAVGRCLAKAVRDVPIRERTADDFQVGEFLLPRDLGERLPIKGDATPWKKSQPMAGGTILEVADDGILADVRGGPTRLKFEEVVRLEEAAEQLTAALRDKPGDATLLLARACMQEMDGHRNEAIADLDAILRDDPRRIDCLLLRAALHKLAGRHEAALPDYAKAIELGEETAYVLRSRGLTLLKLGREDEAIADYERLLKLEPADVTFYTEFAALRLKRVDNDGTCELLRQAARVGTNDVTEVVAILEIINEMAPDALSALNDEKALEELFVRGAKMTAKTAEQFAARGLLRFTSDGVEAAVADWTRAIDIDPKCNVALIYRAMHFGRIEQWDEAIRDLDAAIALAPGREDYLVVRAACYAGQKDFQRAMRDAGAAVELNPKSGQALFVRAMLRAETGEYSKAIDDLAAAIQANPNDGQVHRELAWIWATCPVESLRNGRGAAHAASIAFQNSSRKERDFEVVAAACAAAEQWDSAVAAQERLLTMKPDDAEFQAKHRERLELYRAKKPYHEPAKERLADKVIGRIME